MHSWSVLRGNRGSESLLETSAPRVLDHPCLRDLGHYSLAMGHVGLAGCCFRSDLRFSGSSSSSCSSHTPAGALSSFKGLRCSSLSLPRFATAWVCTFKLEPGVVPNM